MNLIEAVKTGQLFKRPWWNSWQCVENLKTINLSKEDILATDYEVCERWFMGNFKDKYPNGVLCYVADTEHTLDSDEKIVQIIIDYSPNEDFPFTAQNGTYWKIAIPITTDEAPTILERDEAY